MPVNGHSRKGSLLVGEGIDIKKGPIAFGSVDSPSNLLSSSPAAPSSIGGHLANSVQSFGSLPADSSSSSNDIIKEPRRPNMTTATTNTNAAGGGGGGKKPFDVHQFFVGKPASQQPSNPNPNNTPGPSAGPPPVTSPPPANGPPQQQQQQQQQYRPSGPQQMMPQGQMRPQNGPGYPSRPMMMGQPGMPQYAQHGAPQNHYMMQYPGYSYYPPNYEQHYPGQWQAQQQHRPQPPAPFAMSPRGSQNGLPPQPSPAHPSAPSPGNGSISPAPTPPSRPTSHMAPQPPSSNTSMPGTPVRPPSQPLSGGLVPPAGAASPFHNLSGGAQSFTPRKSAAIQIRRPDGSVIDPKEAASPAPKPSGTLTPTTSTVEDKTTAAPESAIKKKGPFPVLVRIESEEAKKARLEEEATKDRCKKEEEAYETEKKERKERQAREAEEKRSIDEAKAKDDSEKATKAKEDEVKAADEKKKLDAAFAAEQEATAKRDAEIAAVEKAAKEQQDQQAKNDVGAAHAVADAAREKADEQRQALLAPSTPASPLSSPRLAAAGLPPKPSASAASAPAAARRAAPAPLDLKTQSSEQGQSSALITAKPITDLNAVTYAAPIQSPSSSLNEGAEPGKFRYDRDFLLQFMSVCKDKPESLPPLEDIGLEPDTSSSFGKRGSRSSVAGTPRTGGTGLGISGAGQQRYPSQGMGTFGAFGSGQIGSLRGTSSEDRYHRSLANAGGGRGGRTPSQQGMQPPMGGRMGGNRSGRGRPRPPQASFQTPDVAVQALQTTENAWVTAGRTIGDDDKRSVAFVSRKVNALLNKLTAEKFDSISNQVLEYANYSIDEENGQTMKLVIQLIFEKATDQALWGPIYARLCRKLFQTVDDGVRAELDGKEVAGGTLFRKYLVGRCQVDFEAGWKEREEAALKAAEQRAGDAERLDEQTANQSAEPAVLSDEYYALQKIKRRGLGLITLIGELFKLEMVSKNVMKTCFVRMLGRGQEIDEEDVESAIKLLKTIGPVYDAQSGENVQGILSRLIDIRQAPGTSQRTQFMILDLIELRDAGWKGKGATQSQTANMTIAEVHQQAAREEAEQRRATQQSISRGGSRVGQARGGNDWQQTPAAPRPSRPADFSNIGRLSSSSAGPSFGPQSTFGRNRRGGAAGQSTPPISRQASQANIPNMSNANQFALLNDSNEAAEATEAAPQRRKLKLAPRTVPKEGEEGADEEQGDDDEAGSESDAGSDDEHASPSQAKEMTETGAKAKIDLDMKELWGEKDQGGSRNPDDIVHYFSALPEAHRLLLANKLYDEVFRTAKYKDAEVVAKGLSSAVEDGAATAEIVKDALGTRMSSLDDDSIDFPQAYKAIALFMRSLSLSAEEIDELVAKIEVYGEPRVTPRMKLDKEFARLDEEAAA